MKYVGKSLPIHDSATKVSGGAKYAGDMLLPGMLHLALLTSEIPHGKVRAIDTSLATALPGVVDVLHCFNTTKKHFNRYRNIHHNITSRDILEQERVFSERVRFVGDRVACVIAETSQAAFDALALINVEYEAFDFATDSKTVIETGVLNNMFPEGVIYPVKKMEMGTLPDLSGGIAIKTGGSIARVNHVTMEPQACVADFDKITGHLNVWSPNQTVHGLRSVLAELFELPYHKLRVIKTTMGGSFGSKQEWMSEPVAVACALHTGRPVKLSFTREQAMLSSITRCALEGSVESTVTKEGKILSLDVDMILDAGAYLSNSQDYCAVISSKLFRFYNFPHAYYEGRAVCTNSPVSGAFRGWGSPELFVMLEHNLNTAAKKLGIDPTEIRLKNAAAPGDIDKKTGISLGEIRAKECIIRGRELFGWTDKRAECEKFNKQSKRFKRGVAIGCGGHGNSYFPRRQDYCGAEMRMNEDGTVIVKMTLHDHGCGSLTAVKMIIAETLGISVDNISLGEGDTDNTPHDVGCFASRTTYVAGRTGLYCAEKLKELLIERVAEIEGRAPEELTVIDGEIRPIYGDGLKYSYAEAAQASLRELQKEIWVMYQFVNDSNPGVTGAHFAYTEVDTLTGMVEVLDYLAVHDIGQAINREITIAQIQGAVAMGAGAALSEGMFPDKKGRFTRALKDYHLRNIPELPEVRVELIEDGGDPGPFGAKSIGELSIVPVAPAIVGAVNHALGSDLNDLPLSPERIVKYLVQRGVE